MPFQFRGAPKIVITTIVKIGPPPIYRLQVTEAPFQWRIAQDATYAETRGTLPTLPGRPRSTAARRPMNMGMDQGRMPFS
jgi:hypothetical protein